MSKFSTTFPTLTGQSTFKISVLFMITHANCIISFSFFQLWVNAHIIPVVQNHKQCDLFIRSFTRHFQYFLLLIWFEMWGLGFIHHMICTFLRKAKQAKSERGKRHRPSLRSPSLYAIRGEPVSSNRLLILEAKWKKRWTEMVGTSFCAPSSDVMHFLPFAFHLSFMYI